MQTVLTGHRYSEDDLEAFQKAYERNEYADQLARGVGRLVNGLFYVSVSGFFMSCMGLFADSGFQFMVINELHRITGSIVFVGFIYDVQNYAAAPLMMLSGICRIGRSFVEMVPPGLD